MCQVSISKRSIWFRITIRWVSPSYLTLPLSAQKRCATPALQMTGLWGVTGNPGPQAPRHRARRNVGPTVLSLITELLWLLYHCHAQFTLAGLDCGDQFAAEGRNVFHDPAPHQVAVLQGWFIDPDRAGVHQVVLDAEAAGGPAPGDYSG